MVETKVQANSIIIKEGEDGDNFYIIESGIFQAEKNNHVVMQYQHKGAFGELALMYNCPRAATITAKTEGILWAVDRISFRNIVVASMSQKRRNYEGILDDMYIFRDLTAANRAMIADCLIRETYQQGDVIIKEGEPLKIDAKFFIVEKGIVECYKTFQGTRQLVKSIESGGFFGEVALISKQHRQADCIAKTDVCLLSMGRDTFERLMGPIETVLNDRIKEYDALNEHFTNTI